MTFEQVRADTITLAASTIADALKTAADGHSGYDPTLIVGRPIPVVGSDCGDLIAVRFAGSTTDRSGCAGNILARFEISVVICIDDDPTQTDPEAVDKDGRRIAQIIWKTWAGMFHNVCARGFDFAVAGLVDSTDVTFGTLTIDYQAGRALGRGDIIVALPAVLVT